ncbi:polyprenyl synthetase family protein [bacterium]|nr:polyprenyl synthetase family protein [bacterium]
MNNPLENELLIIENKMVSNICTREPLNSHIKTFLKSPSKRIRSRLPLLFAKSLGNDISDSQFELLSAIEIIHNASLIHDDIIDESDFRRGEKTISKKFGTKLGVITGDYLLAIAMKKISNLNSTKILEKISYTIRQMCIGEINQNFDRFKIGTIENYIEKSKNKTAYLFETALVTFAMLDNNNYDLEQLSKFGLNFGIAFQIKDDLSNFLNIDKTKSANDFNEGIYTAPIIFSKDKKDYMTGIEKTKDLLNNYLERAEKQLYNLANNIYTEALKELIKTE